MKIKNVALWIGLFAFSAFAAWDGETIREPSKTLLDGRVYNAIGSAEELAWFSKAVNSGDTAISAILTADIDLSFLPWEPIGIDDSVAFDGIFDGDGHSISGISVSDKKYAGLFGVLDVGSVKNLIIANSKIKGYFLKPGSYSNTYSYVGGVAGYAGSKSSIQNVINEASHIEPSKVTVSNGYKSYLYMGGVVGRTEGSIIDCENKGNLFQTDTSSKAVSYIGGIAGNSVSSALKNLNNVGTIEGGNYTGGIVGGGHGISHSTNSGQIKGRRFVGGICGYCSYGVDKIGNSMNEGTVKGEGLKDSSIIVGGICGFCAADSSQNKGNIDVVGSKAYVGGITGKTSYLIRLSLNYGDISVSASSISWVGGIAGEAYYYNVSYSGNFGQVTATSTDTVYVGGIAGKTSVGLSNLFNQGKLRSSHYAAGIVPVLPQTSMTIENFYVATDSIVAPNAAAFVNYNSTTATLQNGFLDGSLIKNLPLVGENVGVGKNLFVVDTRTLQTDSVAYVLDIANLRNFYKSSFYGNYGNSYHWSRKFGYPVFADSAHKPIYQVVFVSHKRCTSLNCTLDSNIRYTNYQGRINPFPDLTDGGVWTLSHPYIKRQNIFKDYVFDWSDSLVVAMYSQCDELASKDMGCCMNYMLDFQKEYADTHNAYYDLYYSVNGAVNPYHLSADSVQEYNCLDDDGDGILNWNDSGSSANFSYNTMKTSMTSLKQLYEQLTTSTQNPQRVALPKVLANGRSIQIENLNGQMAIVILDVQGRVMKSEPATSANMNIPIPCAGRYFVKVGNSITAIDVK